MKCYLCEKDNGIPFTVGSQILGRCEECATEMREKLKTMQFPPQINKIDFISREFVMTKSDWLQLAIDCITVAGLEDDCISIKKAKMSLTYEMEWQKQKEGNYES